MPALKIQWLPVPRDGGATALIKEVRWTVRRAPGFRNGAPVWWLYVAGQRFSPSQRFEDALRFESVADAQAFVAAWHHRSQPHGVRWTYMHVTPWGEPWLACSVCGRRVDTFTEGTARATVLRHRSNG